MSAERRRRYRLAHAPLLVALAFALAGCDGGIFGTGDGSADAIAPTDSNSLPPSVTDSGGGLDGADGEGVAPGNAGEPDVDADEEEGGDGGNGIAPTATFSNTLDVGSGTAPRVRLVNASALSVELVGADGAPLSGAGVPSGSSGTLVELPPTIEELRLRRADADGEEALLYRLVPVALSMSSVTTLIVRDRRSTETPSRGVDVVALETRLAPSDPAQALVRVVQGGRTNDPDEEDAATRYRLVPAGASPGGVEVAFEGIAFEDSPASGYRDIPSGDYRLEGRGPDGEEAVLSPRQVTIGPDSVHTFVIVDTESVIDVVDGPPAKR